MNVTMEGALREQLLERRDRLRGTISEVGQAEDLVRLLREVDAALKKADANALGRCELCGLDVDDDFLLENPLVPYCLCALTPQQQTALEHDLDLARRIQLGLLPKQNVALGGWEVHYRYLPAGPVSGDYCDLVTRQTERGALYFLLGDVSGKGVAAALLMARLNALFRSLIDLAIPVHELVERANRLFTESTVSSHYATLVCGRADEAGEIELCNAGHCPPLLLRDGRVLPVDSTGFPVGLFGESPYEVYRVRLARDETLFLYSDGLTEAPDGHGEQYGVERLSRFLAGRRRLRPAALAAACLEDLAAYQSGTPRADDLTVMVVHRAT